MKKLIKAVLKRTTGVLKVATSFAPLVIGGGGLVCAVGTGFGSMINRDNLVASYKTTQKYIDNYTTEVENIFQDYKDGKISIDDFSQKIDDFSNINYVLEVIRKEESEDSYYGAKLKFSEALYNAFWGNLGAVGLGLLTVCLWYKGPCIAEKLSDSADDDFYEAKKLLKSRVKLLNPPEKKQEDKNILEDTQEEKEHLIDIVDDPVQFVN